jgi:thiamine biosynthesis protein ThiI
VKGDKAPGVDPISIHFHEVALKGGNRVMFERRLRTNLLLALGPLGKVRVDRYPGGMLVEGDLDGDEALRRTLEVCGVAHAMPVVRHPADPRAVAATIIEAVRRQGPANFRITTRRRDKKYPQNSEELNRLVGGWVKEGTGVPVKLQGAALEAFLLVYGDQMLVGTRKHRAVGGLPVGTAGKVAVLLSGGIDSPVAAWRMMKRGCRADFVHFHSYPRVDRATIEKAEELTERLTKWQYRSRLHLVPLLEAQTAVRLHAPERLRVLLYRRFMVRIAERIALRRGCRALVTGESVGQVASQTLQNIAAVDAAATRVPILRPLCGMDKQEIIDQSMQLQTFETSILPDQDCCQLFLPKNPTVASTDEECAEAERNLDVEGLIDDALRRTEVRMFYWPVPPVSRLPASREASALG